MTHPYLLHAGAALHSLRRAADYLEVARDAILLARPQLGPAATRPRSLAALKAHDVLLLAERADRLVNERLGIDAAAGGTTPAPVAPGLLDLERDLADGLRDVTNLVASHLRRRPLLRYGDPWIHTAGSKWHGRCTYLAAALPHISPRLAREVYATLDPLDRRLRALIGLDPDRWPLPGGPPCPACGRRELAAQCSSPRSVDWTVVCTADGCACHGRLCPCGMSSRPAGVAHIWPADGPIAQAVLARLNPSPDTTAA